MFLSAHPAQPGILKHDLAGEQITCLPRTSVIIAKPADGLAVPKVPDWAKTTRLPGSVGAYRRLDTSTSLN